MIPGKYGSTHRNTYKCSRISLLAWRADPPILRPLGLCRLAADAVQPENSDKPADSDKSARGEPELRSSDSVAEDPEGDSVVR